jgi:hypothetical protein
MAIVLVQMSHTCIIHTMELVVIIFVIVYIITHATTEEDLRL